MIQLNKQSGAVLVMSLVLLTVLTIIGVASMSSSTLEMKIASNSQQRNIAFQAAQSRIDFLTSIDPANPLDFTIVIPVPPATPPPQYCNTPFCPNGVDWTATAEVRFAGCGKPTGFSLEAGVGVMNRFFNATVVGRSTGSSRSVQAQGFRIPVAGC